MKYPRLVVVANTSVKVEIESTEPNEYGERENRTYNLKCNWQDKAGVVYTSDKQKVTTSGTALFDGDICPEIPVISSGYITVFGIQRRIVQGQKCRNPDGTVNYTRLDVI